jgi:hypothetical protein
LDLFVQKKCWYLSKKSFKLDYYPPGKHSSFIASPLNINPMVQVEISQLTGECSSWRESLRLLRDEFSQDKTKLQQAASQPLSKDQLKDVEHLHNQFHIQLINIHDLKQAVKMHERAIAFEMASNGGQLKEETVANHESLFEQYQSLDHKLQDLREEFNQFLSRTS